MSDQLALIGSIYAHPFDDTPRLVYADWLEEQGDSWSILRARWLRASLGDNRRNRQYKIGDPENRFLEKGSEIFTEPVHSVCPRLISYRRTGKNVVIRVRVVGRNRREYSAICKLQVWRGLVISADICAVGLDTIGPVIARCFPEAIIWSSRLHVAHLYAAGWIGSIVNNQFDMRIMPNLCFDSRFFGDIYSEAARLGVGVHGYEGPGEYGVTWSPDVDMREIMAEQERINWTRYEWHGPWGVQLLIDHRKCGKMRVTDVIDHLCEYAVLTRCRRAVGSFDYFRPWWNHLEHRRRLQPWEAVAHEKEQWRKRRAEQAAEMIADIQEAMA